MKVLQIIDSLPTGGGARFIVNAVPVFNDLEVETDVLLLDGTETSFYQELKEKTTGNIFSLTIGDRWNIRNVPKIIPYLEKYDLVHVHIFPGSYFAATAKFLSRSKTPLLFTEHNSKNRRAIHPAFKYVEKFVYSKFERVICLTDQVKDFVLKNLKVDPKKLVVIENGIDLEAVQNAAPYTKPDLGLFAHSDQLLLMAARMEAQKDHDTVIRTMKYLPDHFKLLLAGEGSRKEQLMNLAKEEGVEDRIYFLGNRSDILRIMKTVDFIVLSSHFEGLSLAALEALASGKPFIASNVEGLDFIKGGGLLFEKENADELSKIILKLENDKGFYNTTIENCQKKALDYDIKKMVKSYIQVYKNILNL